MSAPTVVEVRQRVAERIAALVAPWKESIWHPEMFGRDASSVAHGAFAVVAGESTPTGGRQRPEAGGVLVDTAITVRFSARVKPKGAVSSYDDALALERAVLLQLVANDWTLNFHLLWVGSTRSLSQVSEEYQLVELRFSARHYLDLA